MTYPNRSHPERIREAWRRRRAAGLHRWSYEYRYWPRAVFDLRRCGTCGLEQGAAWNHTWPAAGACLAAAARDAYDGSMDGSGT